MLLRPQAGSKETGLLRSLPTVIVALSSQGIYLLEHDQQALPEM